MLEITETDKNAVLDSLLRLEDWARKADWKGYDPFDGLSSPYSEALTFGVPLLRQIWVQGVRRFPWNLRPLLGIPRMHSTKGMGFFAHGYLRLYLTHGRQEHLERMRHCLGWLIEKRCAKFRGYSWGNHFNAQTRGGYGGKDHPTVVWTGLIGHAFLDAYEALGDPRYAEVAVGAAEFMLHELGWSETKEGICFCYAPGAFVLIHNSNMIGAGFMARVARLAGNPRCLELAEKAVRFTVNHQTAEGAWRYGEGPRWDWIDSFHTGYNLESLDFFCRENRDPVFEESLRRGYKYFVETFFAPDGTPRYYDRKTRPLDIQCASQGIQTLVSLERLHPDSLQTALRVARWTLANMQDPTGYFYFRKYPFITNKTPTLHWGQGTMFGALSLLDQRLRSGGPLSPGQGVAKAGLKAA